MAVTTDQQRIVLTWKVFIPILLAALAVSNTATGFIFKIEQNEINVAYERERTDRKIESERKKTKQLIYISELESKIHELTKDLKECQE